MIESTLKYEFSFTASYLRVNDMVLFATKYLNEGVMEFNSDKGTINKRMVSEFKKSIDNLIAEADRVKQIFVQFYIIHPLH